MWVANFRVWHETSEAMKLTEKYDVIVTSIYLNEYKKSGHTFVTKALSVNGPDWKAYIGELKNEMKRYDIRKIEGHHIYFTIPITSYSYHTLILDQDVFFVNPFVLKGGYEYWTVGSWDKKNLLRLQKRIGKKSEHAQIELLGMKEQKVDFFLPDILSSLPRKRSEALRKAIEAGYYSFPRKINLKKLSKKIGLSPAALREHLRMAENQLLPAMISQMHSIH